MRLQNSIRYRPSIRTVLIGGMAVVIVALMAVTTFVDVRRQERTERDDFQERGQLLANSLNAILPNPVQSKNLTGIGEVAKAIWAQPDVSFVKVFDADGELLVGPGEDQFPSGVKDTSVIRAVSDLHTVQLWTPDGLEVITPVTVGATLIGAVQFGFDTGRIDDEIRTLTLNRIWQTLALVTGGVAISYIVASYITEPIRSLVRTTHLIASGDLSSRVEGLQGREMKELGDSFNYMANELEDKIRALQESRSRIVTAQENVRRELAVHLHGPVQGRLLGLKAALEHLAVDEGVTPKTSKALEEITETMGQVIREEISSLSRRLYPAIVRRGLVPSLQSLRDQFETTLKIDLDIDEELAAEERLNSKVLPEETRLAVFRIAEEAMLNVIKHADAGSVTISLGRSAGHIDLAITDDGLGFNSTHKHDGLGLAVMLDYAEAVGGTGGFERAPGHGTTVSARLPVRYSNR